MIVILSDDKAVSNNTTLSHAKNQDVGIKLYELLQQKNIPVRYISVSNLNIHTCYNCGYCQTKEYRKCGIKDDMQTLLPEIAKATHTVLVSPLTFGSYSSKIKTLLDRLVVLGDVHYYTVNGELVKGCATAQNGMWAIGVKDHCSLEEETLFNTLVEENRKIMNVRGKGIVMPTTPQENLLNQFTEVILHG